MLGVRAKDSGSESNFKTSNSTIAAAIEHSIGGSSKETITDILY